MVMVITVSEVGGCYFDYGVHRRGKFDRVIIETVPIPTVLKLESLTMTKLMQILLKAKRSVLMSLLSKVASLIIFPSL